MAEVREARPAAAVILVRDRTGGGIELFMVRRHAASDAYADVWVFPGGVVEVEDLADWPEDAAFGLSQGWRRLTERGGAPPSDEVAALALWRAALRELFEEAGVLLVRGPGDEPLRPTPEVAARLAAARPRQHGRELTFGALLRRERLRPDYPRLTYFSHWITPEHLPRRFDTRFFVADLPPGQEASHCGVETLDGVWIAPEDALARHAAGAFPLVLPTRAHLERLRGYPSPAALLSAAARKAVRTVQPRRAPSDADPRSWTPPEATGCW